MRALAGAHEPRARFELAASAGLLRPRELRASAFLVFWPRLVGAFLGPGKCGARAPFLSFGPLWVGAFLRPREMWRASAFLCLFGPRFSGRGLPKAPGNVARERLSLSFGPALGRGLPKAPGNVARERLKKSRPISRVLSWTVIPLACASPRSSSDLPGSPCGPHVAAIKPLASLFGLAPGGVCRAVGVATRAVRSYRTISPLPAPLARHLGGIFLLHFP